MTTAAERKARREERMAKEEKREMFLQSVRTGIRYTMRYALAMIGTAAAAAWLAVVIWDNPQWALNISWGLASLAVGAFLFYKADK